MDATKYDMALTTVNKACTIYAFCLRPLLELLSDNPNH